MENAFLADWFLYLAVIIGLGLVAFIWWSLPRWQLRKFHGDINDPTDRADTEDKFRRTVGQILGGAAILGGLALSLAELQTSRDAIQAQGDNLLQQRLSQQFTKGLELLGKDSPAETFGGISALEQVAKSSPNYHWPVFKSLTNYVRSVSPKTDDRPKSDYSNVSFDVQAILSAIARRNDRYDGIDLIDLRDTNLTHIELVNGNLRGALLENSILRRANFLNADLQKANLNFSYLFWANFEEADLQEASLQGANLERANLQGANLERSDLQWASMLKANLERANLQEANMLGAKLQEANLQGSNLKGANLQGAILQGSNIKGVNLKGANLTETDLIFARGATENQLMEACSDGGTKLTKDLDIQLKSCDGNKN